MVKQAKSLVVLMAGDEDVVAIATTEVMVVIITIMELEAITKKNQILTINKTQEVMAVDVVEEGMTNPMLSVILVTNMAIKHQTTTHGSLTLGVPIICAAKRSYLLILMSHFAPKLNLPMTVLEKDRFLST